MCEQVDAIKQINEFLYSKNKLFSLIGAAGTGKTTVVSKIFLSPIFSNKKIAITATTNKAVSVIEQMFDIEKDNIDFCTIHKICNIKRSITDDGDVEFNFDENPDKCNSKNILNYDIVVIDESSMLSANMLSYIQNIKNKIRGKIIFVGDKYQLPPVNEDYSKVFENNFYEDKFNLSQIKRYKNNILTFSERIRNCIDKKEPISIKNLKNESLSIHKNEIEWFDEYLKEFSYNNTFLAYTNKRCDYINNLIRTKHFKNRKLPEYIDGELIVFNSHYNSIDIEHQKFFTSNTAKILKCSEKNYKLQKFDTSLFLDLNKKIVSEHKITKKENQKKNESEEVCPICHEKMNNFDDIVETQCSHKFCEECIKVWLEKNNTCPFCRMDITEDTVVFNNEPKLTALIDNLLKMFSETQFKVWKLKVVMNGKQGDILVVKKENKEQFEQYKFNLKKNIMELKKYIFANVKKQDNRFILNVIWNYYYVNFIDIFADISYGYCITVHKSQGSTYDKVFIDTKNILAYNRKNYINYKCLYTAVTRSSQKLLMYV